MKIISLIISFLLMPFINNVFSSEPTKLGDEEKSIEDRRTAAQASGQHLPIQFIIENHSPALVGYSLQIELREVNNPIFGEIYPLSLAAASSKSSIIDMGSILTSPLIQQSGVAASNLIARLIKTDGEVVESENHFAHSFPAHGFAGLKVIISPKDPEHLELGNKVEIFPTTDAAGLVPFSY